MTSVQNVKDAIVKGNEIEQWSNIHINICKGIAVALKGKGNQKKADLIAFIIEHKNSVNDSIIENAIKNNPSKKRPRAPLSRNAQPRTPVTNEQTVRNLRIHQQQERDTVNSSANDEAVEDILAQQIMIANTQPIQEATLNSSQFNQAPQPLVQATPIQQVPSSTPSAHPAHHSVQAPSITPPQNFNAAMESLVLENAKLKKENQELCGPDYITIPLKQYNAMTAIITTMIDSANVIQMHAKDANITSKINKFTIGKQEVEFTGEEIGTLTGAKMSDSKKMKLVATKLGLDFNGVLSERNKSASRPVLDQEKLTAFCQFMTKYINSNEKVIRKKFGEMCERIRKQKAQGDEVL